MAIHSINHVQLTFPAGAEGQIRNFYSDLLGLRELPELRYPAGKALRFAAGPQRIEPVPTERGPAASAASHLALEVDNLPELRSRLLNAELALVENRTLPGYLRFYLTSSPPRIAEIPSTGRPCPTASACADLFSKTPTFRTPLVDGKLLEIFVLDSECLMAREFEILFAPNEILASGDSLDIGINLETCARNRVKDPAGNQLEFLEPDTEQEYAA